MAWPMPRLMSMFYLTSARLGGRSRLRYPGANGLLSRTELVLPTTSKCSLQVYQLGASGAVGLDRPDRVLNAGYTPEEGTEIRERCITDQVHRAWTKPSGGFHRRPEQSRSTSTLIRHCPTCTKRSFSAGSQNACLLPNDFRTAAKSSA